MTGKQIAARVSYWSKKLGTDGWQVRYLHEAQPSEDARASTDVDGPRKRAVIRIHGDCPDSQIDREVVHELTHLVLHDLGELFAQGVEHRGTEAKALLKDQYADMVEGVIEQLVDAITGIPFGQFGAEHLHEDVWASAFPV